MPQTCCPACNEVLPHDVAPTGRCPACGHDLAAAPPRPGWIVGERNLRLVARRQRMLLWFVLANILLQFALPVVFRVLPGLAGSGFLCLFFLLLLTMVVLVTQMLAALRASIVLQFLYALMLLAPCVNVLVLLSANGMATRALQRAGLKVGLMGVSDDTVVRFLGAYRCHQCGYSLIGNITGICPECGTPAGDLPSRPSS
jgi:hypothetical protein